MELVNAAWEKKIQFLQIRSKNELIINEWSITKTVLLKSYALKGRLFSTDLPLIS